MENCPKNRHNEENETDLANLTNRLLLQKIVALVATGKSSWLGAGAENKPPAREDQKDPMSWVTLPTAPCSNLHLMLQLLKFPPSKWGSKNMESNFNQADYLYARGLPNTGPICLAKAILLDAMEIYTEWNGEKYLRKSFRETSVWLRSDDDKWIFSFITVCHILRLDPSAVRLKFEYRRQQALNRKNLRIVA
jgi:hypothetical protein